MSATATNTASSKGSIRTKPLVPMTTRLGAVHLSVTDRKKALLIWRDIVGLALIEEKGDSLYLGVDDKVLIVLQVNAASAVRQRSLGLYHVAIHVPERRHLAEFLARAASARLQVSPTDHLVSEAIYAWDLDGHGIEITFETPWRGSTGEDWSKGVYALTKDGQPHSGREPIDVRDLLGELPKDGSIGLQMPTGTRIGHVHVHVNDLDQAMHFYRDVIGFGGNMLTRQFGMGDVSLDYQPHILAFNLWSGPTATQPPAETAHLQFFEIVMPDADSFAAVKKRLEAENWPVAERDNRLELQDPAGNTIHIGLA